MRILDGLMKGSNLSYDLSPPGIHSFLPHTAHRPLALQPAFKLTNSKPSNNGLVRRQQVSVVLGVPTVRRDHQSYLSVTLRSVFDNLSPEEAADCLVVVLVAETDMEAVRALLGNKFANGRLPQRVEALRLRLDELEAAA